MAKPAGKLEIRLAEVAAHNKPNDLWIVIENKVYDLTKFRNEHPGGEDSLDSVGGRDGTKEFIEVGHSDEAREIMKKYFIGDLAASDIKSKIPVKQIGIAVSAVIIGVAIVFLVKRVAIKN